MSNSLRFLDPILRSPSDLVRLRAVVDKAEKIVTAVGKGMNLGDILGDPANVDSLGRAVGADFLEEALTLITRLALDNYRVRTITVRRAIDGQKKFEFIHRATSGWKQFHATLMIRRPVVGGASFDVFNPGRLECWKDLQALPEGTQLTVGLRMVGIGRVAAQEDLALDRWEAIFDAVQDNGEHLERVPTPALEIKSSTASAASTPKAKATAPRATTAIRKPVASAWGNSGARAAVASGPPVLSFKVIINKMDTFVHAGNAHLIITHMRDYAGAVKLFVMRGEKHPVMLDADSVWAAEIRNGETILFEFFGPQPAEDFVKELGKRVNKYTQMDKIANE